MVCCLPLPPSWCCYSRRPRRLVTSRRATTVTGRAIVGITVPGIMAEVWHSPFYGTFGAFEDTYWASHYPGPVQRRYYGYGWDPRLRF